MRPLHLFRTITLASTLLATGSLRADVLVTPSNLQGWTAANIQGGATVGITGNQPRSGNGSLEFVSPNGSGKADYSLTNGSVGGFGLLSDLTALSFDWRRDSSSTNPANQAPALRLGVYDPVSGKSSYLIWEKVYQTANTVNTDTWNAEDLLGGYFWERAFGPSRTIENYTQTLADWVACTQANCTITDNGSNHYTPNPVGPSAWIYEINVGVGSGWNGAFDGEVDNVSFGFGSNAATTYNFELDSPAAVPEPSSIILLGSLVTLASINLRKRLRRAA